MKQSKRVNVLLGGALIVGAATAAWGGKGLGPYYNMKYQSYGTFEALRTTDGQVQVLGEEIETINCGGCDTVLYAPGILFHIKNLGKAPVCVEFKFTPSAKSRGPERFGSGTIVHLKKGKTASKIGGLFYVNGGETGTVDTGYDMTVRHWAPIEKGKCGNG